MHHIGSLAGFTAKALPEQIGDIRLVIHHKDTRTHEAASAIVAR
jgi:hypothetical protein